MTVVSALSVRGLETVMEPQGALGAASFAPYVDQVLGPPLRLGGVVVLDNPPVPRVAGMRERVEGWGARVLYLLPCPPNFAPFERG